MAIEGLGGSVISGIEWDDGNREKCRKHGVPIDEIETALRSEGLMIAPDPFAGEPRVRAVGRTASGRSLFIVYTLRKRGEETYIRPISARYMHRKEIESYDQETVARPSDR